MNQERIIKCETVVSASIEDAWKAWSTAEGAVKFFAPAANISPKPGGSYEIFFNPDASPGQRGAEGMIVLAIQPPTFLSFTWNAPPHLPEVRNQMTHVEVRLSALGSEQTKVMLAHGGWGAGEQWDKAYQYFSRAWPEIVLPRLAYSFENGPIDWQSPPEL